MWYHVDWPKIICGVNIILISIDTVHVHFTSHALFRILNIMVNSSVITCTTILSLNLVSPGCIMNDLVRYSRCICVFHVHILDNFMFLLWEIPVLLIYLVLGITRVFSLFWGIPFLFCIHCFGDTLFTNFVFWGIPFLSNSSKQKQKRKRKIKENKNQSKNANKFDWTNQLCCCFDSYVIVFKVCLSMLFCIVVFWT